MMPLTINPDGGLEGLELMSPVVGKIIKKHRVWREMSQRQMAEMADLHPNYISAIEQGKFDPSIKTLAKIAKALDVPLWEIIKEAEELIEKDGDN